jgi:acyl-CoA thioester hydrolase
MTDSESERPRDASPGRSGDGAHRVQMRWRDLDGLGHVNHTVVLTYLEEGRDAWLAAHGIPRDEYVVGRCTVSFQREIDPTQRAVTVECELRQIGRSSMTTSERILDPAGEVAVEAEFDLVLWDPARRASRPISDEERASLARSREEVLG